MRKRFKVIPDAISKSGKNKGRTTPTGRTSGTKKHLFVEDVLQDIGKCCGVDYCTGTISHSIVPGKVAIWGIQSGSFGQIEVKSITTKSKWKLNEQAIYRKEPGNPTGRLALPFVESVLTELSHCCGSNCHCGYFRLPNWEEKKIYEWGTDESGSVYGPVEVADIPDSARQGIKKKWKIDPNSIYRRKSKHRTGSPRLRGRVEYFEDLLQEMVDSGYIGFDCCGGRLILPDTAVPGTFYEVKIVSGSFQLTEVQDCGVPLPAPTATITTPGGAPAGTAAVVTFANNFPAGTTTTLQVDFNGAGATPVTFAIPPVGTDLTPAQIASGFESLPVWATNNVTPSTAGGVLTLTPDVLQTIEITGATVT